MNDSRYWLRRMGDASSRFISFRLRASTTAYPMPHMPVPMRLRPSRPGIRKSMYREPFSITFCSATALHVPPAEGPLQRVVGREPGHPALRPRGVEPVDHRVARHHDQRDAALAQLLGGPSRRLDGRAEPAGTVEERRDRVRAPTRLDRDPDHLGWTVAEGEPQRDRQQQRKGEHPEQHLRLPELLAETGQGQLPQGTHATHQPNPPGER